MEDLLKLQKTDLEQFSKLLTNYNKDGDSRKTEKYLHNKLTEVNSLYETMKQRDVQLQDHENDQQPYFTEKTMEKLKDNYDKLLSNIITRISKFASGNGANNTNGHEDDNVGNHEKSSLDDDPMQIVLIHRDELTDLFKSAEIINASTSSGYIQAHLETIQANWTEIRNEIQYVRMSGEDTSEVNFSELQRDYLRAIGRLKELLKDKNRSASNAASNNQFSLPKLTLPQFSGSVSEWKGFISLFDRMIHNNVDVDNGLKIEYLKSCLKGDAFKIISHIDPTSENYLVCYDLLRKRYENKRLIMGNFWIIF